MHPHINTFIPVFITEYDPLKQPLGNIILYVQSLDRKLRLLHLFHNRTLSHFQCEDQDCSIIF